MERILSILVVYLASFLAVLIVLPCHEFAHAFAAVKNGDETPKYAGRYTLNPFAHFDPLGLVMLILLRFGWAKPVPVNPDNFRNYKKGCIWVSVAGVLANIALAIIFCPVYLLVAKKGILLIKAQWAEYINALIYYFFYSLFYMNIGLFVFNLLPIYPLDGFRLYDALTTRHGKFYYFLRQNSFYIMIAILLLGYAGDMLGLPWLDIVGMLVKYVSMPILYLWRLILGL
ncbi:MAG: site-2 protease family protein [Clostridia bacterium]|nr:site-2 protease family protein [Clostridia bacterium]